ncbi:MAG TPA: O-antigen ligase family protein [Solirubrobacterales bacterium]
MARDSRFAALGELALDGAGLLAAVPLWLWWASWKGGYPPAVFLAGIGYLALAAVALHLFAPRPPLRRAAAWALAALVAFSAWTLLSLTWAPDRGAAEVTASRQILFLGSFALPLIWSPTGRALAAGLALAPLVALCGALTALGGALADPASLVDGRLAGPTGYPNASAALLVAGALPALVLGSRRELPVSLRAAALGTAGALLGALVLTQSRGGLAVLAIVLALALLTLPGRLRLLIPTGMVVLAVCAALGPLLAVHSTAVDGGDLEAALREAVAALLTCVAVLAAVAAAYAALDARTEIAPRTVRRASRGVAALAAGAVLLGAVGLATSGADVGGWLSDRVESFKTPDYGQLESESTRFTGDLGSNRYDYWRVSAQIFADRPLAGSGAGNFIAPYLERRRGEKSTIYAHSVWLESLATLGAPGFLLLVAFVVALCVALGSAGRRAGPARWAVVGASLPLAVALAHGSVDWVGTFPVLTAPALALAGAAAGLRTDGETGTERSGRALPIAAIAVLAVATVLALPLLTAARLADRGFSNWRADPAGAIDDLERAAELDPLSATPDVRLGVVAIELERPALARRAFESALERDPSAWYPEFQLGLLAAPYSRARALHRLRVARARNPREAVVRHSFKAVQGGYFPDPRVIQHRVFKSGE